jgi:hypothetical protein
MFTSVSKNKSNECNEFDLPQSSKARFWCFLQREVT